MAYQETDAKGRIWNTKITANDSTPREGAEKLGAIREFGDGRRFRYVKMTGGACENGLLLMEATKVTVTDATSASGVGPDGATTTIITDADGSFTVDAYIGWYFQLATSMTGSTEPIKIVGNSATTLTLERTIATALDSGGTDDGEIIAGTAAGIGTTSGDLDTAVIGVGIGTITQNFYGWVQVSGIGGMLSDAITEGLAVSSGGNATGHGIARAGADDNYIGVCIAASGTDEICLVNFNIA